jgi:hypothetical protein
MLISVLALSLFRRTQRPIKLSFRAQENYPNNHSGVAAG